MNKNVPNILTILRVILVPFIILFYYLQIPNWNIYAGIILIIASLTDMADGMIARKYNLVSNFGKFMDPLADKLTQISVLFSLTIVKIIPVWIVVIVIIKEIIMVSGASFLYGKDVVVYSRWYGKLATVLFYIAIVFSLLEKQLSLSGTLGFIDLILYCLALITTIFALIMYIYTLHNKGFINKDDLNKNVTVDKK